MSKRDRTSERDLLVLDNLGLARQQAHRYKRNTQDYDDFYQEACVGLVKAADSFEDMGYAFSTWGGRNARHEIQHYLRDRHDVVRVPRRFAKEAREGKRELYRVSSLDAYLDNALDHWVNSRTDELSVEDKEVEDWGRLYEVLKEVEYGSYLVALYVEGKTRAELGKLEKVRPETISRRTSRALKEARKRLEKWRS